MPSWWTEIQLLRHRFQHILHEIRRLKVPCDRKHHAPLQNVHRRAMRGIRCVNEDNQTGSAVAASLQR